MAKPNKKRKSKLNKFDRFILKYIPKLFEVLGWVAILGVLNYVAFKTQEFGMNVLYFISIVGFMYYLQVYLYNVIFLKRKKNKHFLKPLLLLIVTALIGIGTYLFLQNIIIQLSANN